LIGNSSRGELIVKTLLTAIVVCSAAIAGILTALGTRTTIAEIAAAEPPKPGTAPAANPNSLILHEWGTFTSFSGSNGVPVGFQPTNTDLPEFVYHHGGDPNSKSNRLQGFGTVSMETPVMYFYTDKEIQASIRVDFPKGWITEWYPHAAIAPDANDRSPNRRVVKEAGESIRWNVKLLPGEPARFPREKGENPYYHARETDAAPLQTTFEVSKNDPNETVRSGSVTQCEKFLFYRGVGTFSPPVTVKALGAGKVRVINAAGGKVTGMVLVVVRNGQIGFQILNDLDGGAETVAKLPEASSSSSELGAVVLRGLIAAGLYEREAQAMVKTWEAAWFQEEGARLLYIVPRQRTDELLPITVDPKPNEVVRVVVGRHDFLTTEQESIADRQTERIQAAKAEIAAAEAELSKLGRFSFQARQMAAQRLDAKARQR
jgi:hypothetical protein